MDKPYTKPVLYTVTLLLLLAFVIYARTVILLGFAAILVAIFLNALGCGTSWLTRLRYGFALTLAILFFLGLFSLIFWLYSSKIAEQFEMLLTQLPQAYEAVHNYLARYIGNILPQEKIQQELFNKQNVTQLFSVFSTTVGAIGSFLVVIVIGFYFAYNPELYMNWLLSLLPTRAHTKVRDGLIKIGKSLKWWMLGKCLSMTVIGLSTLIGLSLLHVSLALILGFIAGILAFIPYVGAIIAAIPAVLIAFAHSPLQAVYVSILFTLIHVADGYLVTPFIEQRTVYVPPALSIIAQMVLVVLTGFIGLALATPLIVVGVAFVQQALHRGNR